MFGRNNFPLNDTVVSLSFTVSIAQADVGSIYRVFLPLNSPLITLDNRHSQKAYLSYLAGARWWDGLDSTCKILPNDIKPSGTINPNPRYYAVNELCLEFDFSESTTAKSNIALVVWGHLAAPEAASNYNTWNTRVPATGSGGPLTIKNKLGATISNYVWLEL